MTLRSGGISLVAALVLAGCTSGLLYVGDGGVCDGGCDASGDGDDGDDGGPCSFLRCAEGQVCVDGRCRTPDPCTEVSCQNPGEVCDPRDGMCHLGATDDDRDGYSLADGDCDDGVATINPGAAELCNGLDDDCDREVDEGFPDVDGDGYDPCGFGDPEQADCDDGDAQRRPFLVEGCDGKDNDCDGAVDEEVGDRPCSTGCGDGVERCEGGGWGSCSAPAECECSPVGQVGTEACGACGARQRTCLADHTWSAWDACLGEGECVPSSMGECATGCGSAGSRTCDGACRWSACLVPLEWCNGLDDDCDGACDEGCRQPVHRSYCPSPNDHTYTLSESEAACCGCTVESYNFFYTATSAAAGFVELWRCYSSYVGDTFLTSSSTCEGSADMTLEYSLGFVATSAVCGAVPLYRLYHGGALDHFYTINDLELDIAVANGWIYEGVAGFVWTTP